MFKFKPRATLKVILPCIRIPNYFIQPIRVSSRVSGSVGRQTVSLRGSSVANLHRKFAAYFRLRFIIMVHVRLATIEDVPALQALIQGSVSVLGAHYYSSKQIAAALLHIFGVDTQLILDGTYFIAEVEGQIAGSGGWSKRKTLFGGDQAKAHRAGSPLIASPDSAPDGLLDPATDAARIRAFYVHPQWSRKGIGSLILKSCEDAAREAGFKRVELAATLPGVPFYLAGGYAKGEEISIELPDGQSLPIFRMTKTLLASG